LSLAAGAAVVDITPDRPQFLFGYPHVKRYSTGAHDPLLASALYLFDETTPVLLVSCDVIFVGKHSAQRARLRIESETDISSGNILVAATHTHCGPTTVDMISNQGDSAVPKADPRYVRRLEDGIVEAAVKAYRSARPAKVGLAIADGSCVGTNRHDPRGPADPQVPVLVVREAEGDGFIAVMMICSMHPTVLHEDSTLVSADFPWATRQYLQRHVVGADGPIVYFTGPAGDQSPRHVARANTFAEAERLGGLLGQSVAKAITAVRCAADVQLACWSAFVDLPLRSFPSVAEAETQLAEAARRLESLRAAGGRRGQVRTAECDWFGAEETLALARAAADGRLQAAAASVLPAEIMALGVGPWTFVGWPGECYVEFALAVKQRCPDCFVISLAGGELQGYLATLEAVRQRRYEALNAVFDGPRSGDILVKKTLELLGTDEAVESGG
jgi:hypothetical protein